MRMDSGCPESLMGFHKPIDLPVLLRIRSGQDTAYPIVSRFPDYFFRVRKLFTK